MYNAHLHTTGVLIGVEIQEHLTALYSLYLQRLELVRLAAHI